MSEQQEEINAKKSESLSVLTDTSKELNRLIASRKTQLDPLLKALNKLKEEHQILESKYSSEKQKYDSTVMKLDNEKMGLVTDTDKLEVF